MKFKPGMKVRIRPDLDAGDWCEQAKEFLGEVVTLIYEKGDDKGWWHIKEDGDKYQWQEDVEFTSATQIRKRKEPR